MGKAAPEVIYRADEDILIIRFDPPRPAITIELGDGTLARVDPESNELLALEVLNWTERMEARASHSTAKKKNGAQPKRRERSVEPFLPRGLVPA
jgi:hypothetical protein